MRLNTWKKCPNQLKKIQVEPKSILFITIHLKNQKDCYNFYKSKTTGLKSNSKKKKEH